MKATLATADHVVLYSDFDIDPATPLPDGVLTITQNIRVCEKDAMDYGATVAIITHTFTFDTTKGNTTSADGAETLIPLSGEAYLSIRITWYLPRMVWSRARRWRHKKVSLDGVKFFMSEYEYLPTGSRRADGRSAPSDWTDMINSSIIQSDIAHMIKLEMSRPGN